MPLDPSGLSIAMPSRTRSARHPALRAIAVGTCLALTISAAACSRRTPPTQIGASATPTTSPTPSATATPGPTATPTPTPSATPTKPPAPKTVNDYLALIPDFGPAPKPVPVTLEHDEGRAAWQHEIPTKQKVAFITIDDGAVRHPWALKLLREAKVPVTLFLTTNYVSGHVDYFGDLRDTGYAEIEGHTVSHPDLTDLSYDAQKKQLCDSSDRLKKWYGKRPLYFRPPYGEKNSTTLKAAWDCGLKAGFHWRETVDKGKVRYQRTDKKIHAGDIILMHFRPAFPDDFIAALKAIKKAGLTPALLEDYVHVDSPE